MADPSIDTISSLRTAFMTAVLAQAQAGYIKTLIEQGLSETVAVQLAESTTAKFLETGTDILGSLTELVKVVGQNAPAIATAVQSTIAFIDEVEHGRR